MLYVNGARVASGPSDRHTRSLALLGARSRASCAPWQQRNRRGGLEFRRGRASWRRPRLPRAFDSPARASRRAQPGWRVAIDAGHSAIKGSQQIDWQYYVASAPEVIDATKANWNWTGDAETGAHWRDAIPAPAAARRTLIADPLPPQVFEAAEPGRVVRSSLAGGEDFPARPVVVPANTTAKLLMRRDAMISGYPALDVAGRPRRDHQARIWRGAVRRAAPQG